MSYTVTILRRAQKELAELPLEAYEQIRDAVRALAQNPGRPGVSSWPAAKDGAFELGITGLSTKSTIHSEAW